MNRDDAQKIVYQSQFFKKLTEQFKLHNWVDIECRYFNLLRTHFKANSERKDVIQLNNDFDYIIEKLSEYFQGVNNRITSIAALKIDESKLKIAFKHDPAFPLTFLNFNYTDTLTTHNFAREDEIIHIHGRVSDLKSNPIIFGYGDETDPAYQSIEDSGDNVYLDHIKSFGYFKANNYTKLISLLDSNPYIVYIVGHSCGLSDRVLLSEIFEHKLCVKIEVFYHRRSDGTDNFKELTQEISRHFKPTNKQAMRRKVGYKDPDNFIPQNI